jgi:hypothetical protein
MSADREPLQVYIAKKRDTLTTSSVPLKEAYVPDGKQKFVECPHDSPDRLMDFLGALPAGSDISCTHDAFGTLPEAYRDRLTKLGAQVHGISD